MNKFPVRRADTITRRNVERMMREFPAWDAQTMAAYFAGTVVRDGEIVSRARPRHVMRCWRLMPPKPQEATK